MATNFDALLGRVESAARAIRANGFLNTMRDEDTGEACGFEVRFQPNPLFLLWRERRFGWSQRCASGDLALRYTEAVESAARLHAAGLEADDPEALDAVLTSAEALLRQP